MAWIDEKLAELAKQLAYSPADKRSQQLAATYELFPQIDTQKSYPWEFILFRITGYRPKDAVEHAIAGQTLRSDLARLIDFLSETLSIPASQAGQRVLVLEDVTRQFAVSTKTIQRWRRMGLLGQRYVFDDGRKRLGFLESAVREFSSANADRVARSATFRQLSERERKVILRAARRMAARCRCCLKEISRRIARKLNRSPETIRYTIRKFDRQHPESAIFADKSDPISVADRACIINLFDRGVPVETLAKRYCRTRSSIYRVVTQSRAERIKALSIEYIANPLFDHPEADNIILNVLPQEALAKAQVTVAQGTNAKARDLLVARVPRDLPPDLHGIFNQPVMPQELEIDAFRRMNYLRFKARRLQKQLDIYEARSTDLAEIEDLLTQAHLLKNQLVQSGLRIAVHVARKHQRPGLPLPELISDANIWLMRSVERFDFARNVKFSTYASYAIMKNFARGRTEQIARPDRRLLTGQDEFLSQVNNRDGVSSSDRLDNITVQGELLSVIDELPTRERDLVVAHYGLDQTQPALSLSELGLKMGLTKTRVRQIETRALRKLRVLIEARRALPV
jgi:RNA polymerase sigma factor (sigma-70 family)